MSRNGSGTYSLPAGNPVVTGTTISSSWANNTMNDIASALTGSVAADGQTPLTGNLNANSNKIINLANPTLAQDAVTKSYADTNFAALGGYGFKNRIINGAMVIDQRNAGAASANTINGYFLDRWQVLQSVTGKLIAQQNAGSVTPPTGFSNYLGVTSQSAYSVGASDYYNIVQFIEGFNFADMAWGTANAKTVTLSFWVRSSLTGTFGGSFRNASNNRSYPFTYSISSANTWEQKSITIAGDTTGTWVGATNGIGVQMLFGLGVGSTLSGTAGAWAGSNFLSATGATSVVGTNGATFYITGVQLEVGSTATSFDYRPYGTELVLCQRYYQKSFDQNVVPADGVGAGVNTTIAAYSVSNSWTAWIPFPVTMRSSPTITGYRASGLGVSNGLWGYYLAGWTSFTTQAYGINTTGFYVGGDSSSAFTTAGAYVAGGHFTASAEL